MKGIATTAVNSAQIVLIKNEIPVVSHLTIAEMTNNDKISIRKLIDNNLSDLEEFGRVSFEMTTQKTRWGKQEIKEYFLNEQQATLLMTYLRNNSVVKEFKKNLVRAFYTLKENSLKTPTHQPIQNSRLASQGFAIPNFALMNDDIGQFWLTVWQWLARVQEMMTEQNEQLILAKNLLTEQHEIINTLTEENEKLAEENYELKSNPLAMLTKSLQIATGREVNLSLWPTTGNIDHTHTTIKGFCAEHKIKLNQWDSIKFATIVKKLCKQAGEIIEKIPDARYGTLNIYPRYLLADAVKFL